MDHWRIPSVNCVTVQRRKFVYGGITNFILRTPGNFIIGLCVVCLILSCLQVPAQARENCLIQKYDDRSNIIISPEPEYPNNFCKYWYIQAPQNSTITISFDYLDILSGDDMSCDRDFLKIGPSPEHTYCGKVAQPYIATVLKHSVWLYFQTDISGRSRGFKLHYIVDYVPSRAGCRRNETMCGNGKCILSQWKCNGYQECGDGSDERNCPSGTLTPTEPPANQCEQQELLCHSIMSGEEICLHEMYQCDHVDDCIGGIDELLPTCRNDTCRYSLGGLRGNFSSPRYPHSYLNNQDCQWTIHVPGGTIQLRFQVFVLQDRRGTDYVTIYDGKDEYSDVIGTFYGGNVPPPIIESSTNWLYIKFHSDAKYLDKGFYATYQKKGVCFTEAQSYCEGENDCFYNAEKCDGVWNCKEHGYDERGCGRCTREEFNCGSMTAQCYSESQRCDGNSHCLNNADENNCTSDRCGPHKGLFLCRNKRCIYETWECDRTDDCEDHSDEDDCPSPFFTRRVIVAAVTGSLICSLLLVIALGCICKVYALRMNEQYGPRHESPMSRLQAEFLRRRAPPPPYHEAMLTSRPYEEARRDYLTQSRDQRRRRSGDRRRNRALPPTPEEPPLYQTEDDVQLLTVNSTNEQGANTDTSSTAQLILPTNSSDSSGSEREDNGHMADDDDDDSVLIDLTEGEGGTAAWRSVSQRNSDEERSPQHLMSDAGGDSIDSASANISVDNMNIALHETLDKENGVEVDQLAPLEKEAALSVPNIATIDSTADSEADLVVNSQISVSTSVPEVPDHCTEL